MGFLIDFGSDLGAIFGDFEWILDGFWKDFGKIFEAFWKDLRGQICWEDFVRVSNDYKHCRLQNLL